MYKINTTRPYSSISSSHGLFSLHAHEPGGLADRESCFSGDSFNRHQRRFLKKFHEQKTIVEKALWLIQICKELGIPSGKGVSELYSEVCHQLSKEVDKGYDNVTLDRSWLVEKLGKCLSSITTHAQGLEQTGLFRLTWIYTDQKYPTKIKFTMTPFLISLLKEKEMSFASMERLRESCNRYWSYAQNRPETGSPLLQHNMLEFSSSREKSVTEKNKNVTKIEKEKKNIAESKPYSATPEQAQDRIAIKTTEEKGDTETLSGTPTKSPEPQAQKTKPSFKKSWKEKKRAGKTEQRILRTPEIEKILQEGWEYFKPIFQKEDEKPVLACSEEDFKTILSSRMTSHFSTLLHITTYLDKISINQLLMGKRVMTNGKVWDLRLGFIFDDKIISASHNPYGQWPFISYNERDLSKIEEASVPKDMLEKLNLSQDQLTTVCEVVNEHMQHLEAKLVDKSAPKLTLEQMQKLIAARPVNVAHIPSESNENAEKTHEINPTQEKEKLLGDVSSLFDEAIKKHLLIVLPYNTYKAWIIDAKASFEEAEFGWKVIAKGKYSQAQIETKFSQFIDQACRNYSDQKAKVQDQQQSSQEVESWEELPKLQVLTGQENLSSLHVSREIHEDGNVVSDQAWKTDQTEPEPQTVSLHYSGSFRRILQSFIVLITLSGLAQAVEIKSCFTSQQQCLPLIVRERQNDHSEILMQTYSFTYKPISKSLRDVHDRGLKVKMLDYRSQEGNNHFQDDKMKIWLRPWGIRDKALNEAHVDRNQVFPHANHLRRARSDSEEKTCLSNQKTDP